MDSGDWKTVSTHYIRDVIHNAIDRQSIDTGFKPSILVAASEDAVAITRLVRDELRARDGQSRAILTCTLLEYNDSNPYRGEHTVQWQGTFSGQHVLVVDKADQTRASIVQFITNLQQGAIAQQASATSDWVHPQVAVFVLHNKRRAKTADLPEGVLEFVGEEMDDVHIAYATSTQGEEQPQAHHHHASGTQPKAARPHDAPHRPPSRPTSPLPTIPNGLLRSVSSHYVEALLEKAVDEQQVQERFNPTMLVAANDGALAPARLLRHYLRFRAGHHNHDQHDLPVLTPRLELYDEDTNPYLAHITGVQAWGPASLAGQRVLVVDRADNTRTTLATFITKLESLAAGAKAEAEAQGAAWAGDPVFGVFVLHNKQVDKQADLPQDILNGRYFYGEVADGSTVLYPFNV